MQSRSVVSGVSESGWRLPSSVAIGFQGLFLFRCAFLVIHWPVALSVFLWYSFGCNSIVNFMVVVVRKVTQTWSIWIIWCRGNKSGFFSHKKKNPPTPFHRVVNLKCLSFLWFEHWERRKWTSYSPPKKHICFLQFLNKCQTFLRTMTFWCCYVSGSQTTYDAVTDSELLTCAIFTPKMGPAIGCHQTCFRFCCKAVYIVC